MTCPCGSDMDLSNCCGLIHNNLAAASTAEQLMRARYTAFVIQNIDFIYNTFHPTTRRFQQKADIQKWAIESKWMGLEIVKSTNNTVEFKAHYLDQNLQPQLHHEKSTFKQVQNQWYYLDGVLK